MRRFIIYLIRKRLGLKKYQHFVFDNQRDKDNNKYYFIDIGLMKIEYGTHRLANVSLNWLLNDECRIEKIEE